MNGNVATTSLTSALASLLGVYLGSKGLSVDLGTLAIVVGAATGGVTGLAHWVKERFFPTPAKPAVASPTSPPVAAILVCTLLLGTVVALGLTACADSPTQKERAGVMATAGIVTTAAIQDGTTDPAVWKERASAFKSIALQLQSVNDAGDATLATLAADLQPLVVKLGPGYVAPVNALVAALTPYITLESTTNPTVTATKERVAIILEAVITACTAYGA